MKRMVKPRNLSHQFNFVHDRIDKGYHALSAHSFDGQVARVSFEHHNDPLMDRPSRIDVDYLKSHREGQGHAKALMEHMYQRYPKSFIDWGLTIHPAATHLAQQFENKYYDRTAYEPNDDEYVDGTEGMYSGHPDF